VEEPAIRQQREHAMFGVSDGIPDRFTSRGEQFRDLYAGRPALNVRVEISLRKDRSVIMLDDNTEDLEHRATGLILTGHLSVRHSYIWPSP
jgi:hypothetical protein